MMIYLIENENLYLGPSSALNVLGAYLAASKLGKNKKRCVGGGRCPQLGILEEYIFDEIVEMRVNKMKVKRSFVRDRSRQLGQMSHFVEFID